MRKEPTPLQLKYLRRLLDGPAPRDTSFHQTGFICMQRGWTEWDYRINGRPVAHAEYWKQFRDSGLVDHSDDLQERITDAGRAVCQKQAA